MGAELFELEWIKGILLFFNYFAWALYGVGLVVAVFDMAIEAQRGKGGFQDVGLNAIKGFLPPAFSPLFRWIRMCFASTYYRM